MAAQLYALLAQLGYHHPLHPVLTHLPVGLAISSFFFLAAGYISGRQDFAQTAHHCTVLALIALVPTAALGYLDWRHYYGGATLMPIRIKIVLAGVLFLLLLATLYRGGSRTRPNAGRLLLHLMGLVCVVGLGYFGGELVYGSKSVPAQQTTAAVAPAADIGAGAELFQTRCSVCHFTDSRDKKVGPGLQGMFQMPAMPTSGWPMNEENLRKQFKTPFKEMPSFDYLKEEEVDALIAYLKTL